MINSPLNYTGNKYKLLNQIMPYLNKQSNKFVDVFAGSGLVGLNSDCKEVILNDNNKITVELLDYFKNNTSEKIIDTMDRFIKEYGFTDTYRNGNNYYIEEKHEGLSRYNREPFNRLKFDYNKNPSIDKLFALIIYGFNHYIRFNLKGEYNVPVGKVDYSSSLREKTKEYIEAFGRKNIKILNYDFRNMELYKDKEAIYYFDPPYLITDAPYNAKWSIEDEKDLLKILDYLNDNNIKFALSNVIESNGKENTLLKDWCVKYNVFNMDRKYLNSNYRKKNITIAKEVLITNYKGGKMGTSGNKPGYKVFSINTTIRNPRRNTEFLEVLQDFDNKKLTKDLKKNIYVELIRRGIYKVNNLDNTVKEKYQDNVLLEDEEIHNIIANNPQKTGNEGRLMTQIRALKDTGFVNLIGSRNKKLLQITPLGKALLNNENVEDIYSKAMIGLHSNNPQRDTIYNRARPFLNTLFVIKEIDEYYNSKKGILWHEFAFFVLPMKDCNYKKAAEEIIKYRNKYEHKIDKSYLENYIYNEVKVNKIQFRSILRDYADDVYRKFNMTGLVYSHGFGENTYISYTPYYIEKVNSIIEEYRDYQFNEFKTTKEYTNYLTNINLPWEKSEEIKKKIIKNQKETLNIEINEKDSLDEQMKKLNSIYNKRVFDNFVEDISKEEIIKELILLNRNQGEKSEYKDIPNSVRLEWFIAMFTAKIYGTKYVNPNLILDNKGIPKSFAPGGKADIELNAENLYCLIEVTLMRDYKQQLNSETTSIADHLNSLDVNKKKCSLMIAPIVHHRVVKFFDFTNKSENTTIVASTIEHYIESIKNNNSIDEFISFIYNLREIMSVKEDKEYCDVINFTKVENLE